MDPTQPFRFSRAEKLVLLASALAGVGVPWAVIRPDGALIAALFLLAAFASAAAGVALHLRHRRKVRRSVARLEAGKAEQTAARSGWADVAPAT